MMKRWPANILTSGNLFCGLFSILLSVNARYEAAAGLILLAVFLDALDGKAARFFKVTSPFGLQFDSLADMVSFGVAPAVLVYEAAFAEMSLIGLILTFIPVSCTAIRLARFNALQGGRSRNFEGLSSPLHAGLLASFIIMNYSLWGEIADARILSALVLLSSLLMVSRLPLAELPRFTLRDPGYNSAKMLFLACAVILVSFDPLRFIFPVMSAVVLAAFAAGITHSLFNRIGSPLADIRTADKTTSIAGGHQ